MKLLKAVFALAFLPLTAFASIVNSDSSSEFVAQEAVVQGFEFDTPLTYRYEVFAKGHSYPIRTLEYTSSAKNGAFEGSMDTSLPSGNYSLRMIGSAGIISSEVEVVEFSIPKGSMEASFKGYLELGKQYKYESTVRFNGSTGRAHIYLVWREHSQDTDNETISDSLDES